MPEMRTRCYLLAALLLIGCGTEPGLLYQYECQVICATTPPSYETVKDETCEPADHDQSDLASEIALAVVTDTVRVERCDATLLAACLVHPAAEPCDIP